MIFNSFYFRVGCACLERTDFYKVSYFGKGVMVTKELISDDVTTLWEGVVVLERTAIVTVSYFGRVWWS